jgi:hypothetical protein
MNDIIKKMLELFRRTDARELDCFLEDLKKNIKYYSDAKEVSDEEIEEFKTSAREIIAIIKSENPDITEDELVADFAITMSLLSRKSSRWTNALTDCVYKGLRRLSSPAAKKIMAEIRKPASDQHQT